jgi:hypothetical protein
MGYSKNPLPKRQTIWEMEIRLKQEAKELLKAMKEKEKSKTT